MRLDASERFWRRPGADSVVPQVLSPAVVEAPTGAHGGNGAGGAGGHWYEPLMGPFGFAPDRGKWSYVQEKNRLAEPTLVEAGRHAGRSRVEYTGMNIQLHLLTRDFFISAINTKTSWIVGIVFLVYLLFGFFWSIPYYLLVRYYAGCIYGASSFVEAWTFSFVTQMTIGYGNTGPQRCWAASWLIAVQSIASLLLDAITFGIIFARISHPKQRSRSIFISDSAVVSRRDGVLKLMFRVADVRRTQVVDPKIKAFVYTWGEGRITAEGERIPVRCEALDTGYIDGMLILPLTIEHTIDERSPLCGHTHDSLLALNAEIVVTFEGTTEFGNPFMARRSYVPADISWGYQFVDVIQPPPPGESQYVIDLERFHDVVPQAGLPPLPPSALSALVVSRAKRTVPYPLLGENTFALSDVLCLRRDPERPETLLLSARAADTYPNQMVEITARMFLYRWALPEGPAGVPGALGPAAGPGPGDGQSGRTSALAHRHGDACITVPLDVGYSDGSDRLHLRLPVEVTHVIDERSPLADWLDGPRGMSLDAHSELVVVLNGYMYTSSSNVLRQRTYSVAHHVRLGCQFMPIVKHPALSLDRKPRVRWALFHDVEPAEDAEDWEEGWDDDESYDDDDGGEVGSRGIEEGYEEYEGDYGELGEAASDEEGGEEGEAGGDKEGGERPRESGGTEEAEGGLITLRLVDERVEGRDDLPSAPTASSSSSSDLKGEKGGAGESQVPGSLASLKAKGAVAATSATTTTTSSGAPGKSRTLSSSKLATGRTSRTSGGVPAASRPPSATRSRPSTASRQRPARPPREALGGYVAANDYTVAGVDLHRYAAMIANDRTLMAGAGGMRQGSYRAPLPDFAALVEAEAAAGAGPVVAPPAPRPPPRDAGPRRNPRVVAPGAAGRRGGGPRELAAPRGPAGHAPAEPHPAVVPAVARYAATTTDAADSLPHPRALHPSLPGVGSFSARSQDTLGESSAEEDEGSGHAARHMLPAGGRAFGASAASGAASLAARQTVAATRSLATSPSRRSIFANRGARTGEGELVVPVARSFGRASALDHGPPRAAPVLAPRRGGAGGSPVASPPGARPPASLLRRLPEELQRYHASILQSDTFVQRAPPRRPASRDAFGSDREGEGDAPGGGGADEGPVSDARAIPVAHSAGLVAGGGGAASATAASSTVSSILGSLLGSGSALGSVPEAEPSLDEAGGPRARAGGASSHPTPGFEAKRQRRAERLAREAAALRAGAAAGPLAPLGSPGLASLAETSDSIAEDDEDRIDAGDEAEEEAQGTAGERARLRTPPRLRAPAILDSLSDEGGDGERSGTAASGAASPGAPGPTAPAPGPPLPSAPAPGSNDAAGDDAPTPPEAASPTSPENVFSEEEEGGELGRALREEEEERVEEVERSRRSARSEAESSQTARAETDRPQPPRASPVPVAGAGEGERAPAHSAASPGSGQVPALLEAVSRSLGDGQDLGADDPGEGAGYSGPIHLNAPSRMWRNSRALKNLFEPEGEGEDEEAPRGGGAGTSASSK